MARPRFDDFIHTDHPGHTLSLRNPISGAIGLGVVSTNVEGHEDRTRQLKMDLAMIISIAYQAGRKDMEDELDVTGSVTQLTKIAEYIEGRLEAARAAGDVK